MIHSPFDHGTANMTALHASARLSIRRALLLVVLGAVLTAGLCASLVVLLGGSAMLAVLVSLITGGVSAGLAVNWMSIAIANIAMKPVELLIAQLNQAGEDVPATLNAFSGKALGQAAIDADVALLSRRARNAARQGRAMIIELEKAREQANQQNIAKSQFLASMSHELRTPLNAILGYAMLLQEDASDAGNSAAVADLDRIQQAGRNLLTLINDILDLSKLEAGKATIERSVIEVAALAESVSAGYREDSERNGNSFELSVSDDVGIMIGDPSKVRQCLINLLSNAFKFTRDGAVALSIEPVPDAAVPSIMFKVRDTGIGIDEDHLDSLFEAFKQAESGATRQFAGTGLGLAITRRLARMMGGDCTVTSERGRGSTFRLVLPLSPQAEPAGSDDRLALRTQADARQIVPQADRYALIIDDDDAAIDLMQRWLGRMGYGVIATIDGEEGLKLAREHRPDLVLLDALLPGRSGYELLVELRADPEIGDTPVILITVDDDRARGLEAGASDYLRKPITESQLRAALEVYHGKAAGEILVIEDDDDAAELIKRSVEQIGFSTRRASDGRQGVAMASDQRPAAIVLDLLMPGMDGFEVIDRLADDGLAEVPLIVLSGMEITLSQHRKLAAAGHRFFTKGASTPREIAQSLREMVA